MEVQVQEYSRLTDAGDERATRATEFITRAAFAIRSPVNIILGYSELIGQRLIALGDDSQRPYLEGIQRASKQILDAINRIIDYSSIEAGTLRSVPERIDLGSLLEKLVQDYRVLAAGKGLGLICEIAEPAARVRCDSYCLSNALSNLIDNAIKFTQKGGAVVKLYRDDQARLSIDIRDTGAGFVPEELIRALDGSREASDDQRYTQSGLGLILTRKYLDLVGALLTISSSPGKGSVFTVTLPASMEIGGETREEGQSSPANASKEPAGPVEPAGPAGARPTIVVVEDQPDQALFMRAVLQSRYTVVLAADAAQAVMRLEELGERVRLILMDVLLGGGEDGLSLTRRLRADRRWKHLPVVVTTAHAFEEDRERALAAGCTAYLAKPINAAQLVATIERLVG